MITKTITYCDAINEAIMHEMERDPSVFIYGIGVPDHKKIFGSTKNILEKFGPNRCLDTPISEDAMTGVGLGAAINGLRPIHVHIRVEFLLLAMNQIANMISSFNYGYNVPVPIVIRAIIGRGWGQGFQHSKSMHSTFAHIPGLKVICPTTPRDAKGMMLAAIQDNNPVLIFEHRWLYWQTGEVPVEDIPTQIGIGHIVREGKHVTVVATSWMNVEALVAANILKEKGIEIEIIDHFPPGRGLSGTRHKYRRSQKTLCGMFGYRPIDRRTIQQRISQWFDSRIILE